LRPSSKRSATTKCCSCHGDVLGAGVEGVDERGPSGCERRETPPAAADVENAPTVQRDQTADRGGLGPFFVASLHRLPLRLVRLQGGAAGAELGGLAPRVLELRPGVGIDELARLDSFEPVAF
jgi:hypothetical protein